MADARFFDRQGPFTLRDILTCAGIEGLLDADLDRQFDEVG